MKQLYRKCLIFSKSGGRGLQIPKNVILLKVFKTQWSNRRGEEKKSKKLNCRGRFTSIIRNQSRKQPLITSIIKANRLSRLGHVGRRGRKVNRPNWLYIQEIGGTEPGQRWRGNVKCLREFRVNNQEEKPRNRDKWGQYVSLSRLTFCPSSHSFIMTFIHPIHSI